MYIPPIFDWGRWSNRSPPPPPPTHTHTQLHCTHGTCGVLHCLLFCDQTRPNLRISLVGYHCAIEFPCGVLLFYCCKYPTTYGVRVHTHTHTQTCTYRQTCGVLPLSSLLFILKHFRPTPLRCFVHVVGYHCAIEFPCGVPYCSYCCKYPGLNACGVRVHVHFGQSKTTKHTHQK